VIDIKVLDADDAGILRNVAPAVFDDPIDMQAADAFLRDPRHHLAVALDDDVVVGFVSAVHYVHPDKPRPELWINEVGVAPTHQGRGLGKALMQTMLETARRIGCAEAWVLTDRANVAAMRLYSSSGGTEPSDHVMYTFHLDDNTEMPTD
jgi:GNAT superfamily N-acetyltransferase